MPPKIPATNTAVYDVWQKAITVIKRKLDKSSNPQSSPNGQGVLVDLEAVLAALKLVPKEQLDTMLETNAYKTAIENLRKNPVLHLPEMRSDSRKDISIADYYILSADSAHSAQTKVKKDQAQVPAAPTQPTQAPAAAPPSRLPFVPQAQSAAAPARKQRESAPTRKRKLDLEGSEDSDSEYEGSSSPVKRDTPYPSRTREKEAEKEAARLEQEDDRQRLSSGYRDIFVQRNAGFVQNFAPTIVQQQPRPQAQELHTERESDTLQAVYAERSPMEQLLSSVSDYTFNKERQDSFLNDIDHYVQHTRPNPTALDTTRPNPTDVESFPELRDMTHDSSTAADVVDDDDLSKWITDDNAM
jgi:hypothetical protein